MEIYTFIKSLLVWGFQVFGGCVMVISVIYLFISSRNHDQAGQTTSLWGLAGGAICIVLGQAFNLIMSAPPSF